MDAQGSKPTRRLKPQYLFKVMTDEKQTRVPRNYEAIEKGALALELAERVSLRNKLTESIDETVKNLETELNRAKEIVNGK